jgi:hypothetical protein
VLRPILKRIIGLIFAASDGPTKGIVPKNFTVEFNSLYQEAPKEIAETRKIQAETDQINITNGVLLPSEVRASRFGSGSYSFETTIDTSLDAEMDDIEEETEADPQPNEKVSNDE